MSEPVEELLHDAERADSGADFAITCGDAKSHKELVAKRDALLREAMRLDPDRTADAWGEVRDLLRRARIA